MLSVLSTTPPSPERDIEEMKLRMSLARSLMAVRGFTVEVEDEFTRALTLSDRTGESARRAPVLRALAFYYMTVANMEEFATIKRQLLTLGELEADPSIIVEGHLVLGVTTGVTGGLMEGLDHLEKAKHPLRPGRPVRSRQVAAKSAHMFPPSECPNRIARSDQAASITARRSSIRTSSVGRSETET